MLGAPQRRMLREALPTARDWKEPPAALAAHVRRLRAGSLDGLRIYTNPDCSEEVMGWPIGWTAAAPLATARFRSWLRRHGASC